jgi:TPR repeat protein
MVSGTPIIAAALLLRTSLACAGSANNHGIDCSPAPWPPRTAPDVLHLALSAQEDAPTGDAATKWLLGSLYLFGLGVPKDRTAATNWMAAAVNSAIPALGNLKTSEMELFSIMLNTAEEELPVLVQQYGAAWGLAVYKHQSRVILQALSSDCVGDPLPSR